MRRLRRPVLVALTAAITAGVTLNLPAAEAETPVRQTVTVIDLYQPDTPAYTAEMDVSWHDWAADRQGRRRGAGSTAGAG